MPAVKDPKLLFFKQVKPDGPPPSKGARCGVAKVPDRVSDENKRVLNPDRKELLERILQKEKNKTKRNRLIIVLTDKLTQKFGTIHKNLIVSFVERVVGNKTQLSSEDMVILERDIHDALKVRKPTTAKPILSENQDNIEKVLEQKSNETVGLDGNEWKVIRAYESILDEEKEKAEKIMHNLKKEQYRKLLNLQEKENNKLKNEATIKKPYGDPLEKDYAIQVNQDVKDFHEEELNKKKELLLKNKDELIVRKEQIVDQAKRREEEKRIQIEHDIENLKLANDKTAIELEKAALKKREARAALLKIELDNIENKKIRDAKKAEEAALDQKLMAEYSAKLDKEAFERENAFKKRLEGMAAFAQKYEDDGAGKALREAKIAEEKLLLKEQLAKADADLAKEVKKAEEIRLRALNSLTENDKLLKEKAARVEEQKRIDHLFAIKFKKDEEEFRTENKELKIKKKENQNKYRQVLDEQKHLKDSEVKISKNGMEAREKELNMSILKKAIDDPVILSKVLHRVRMTDGREKVRNAPKKTAL